jgi:aryl-alcohol dehydrogenase-like predicted oxidoreductase
MPPTSDRFGLGCWSFGGGYWLDQDRQDSIRTIHAALRAGIRHFDTAQSYGNGRSEQLTGQQLRRFAPSITRGDLTIATKILLPPNPAQLRNLVELSLRRLCTDYLDILYVHWPDSAKNHRSFFSELQRLLETGLVRAIGVSNFTPELLTEVLSYAPISYCQMPVSLLWRRSLERLGQICHDNAIAIIAYSPLGMGLLSGKYPKAEAFKPQDRRRTLFPFQERYASIYRQLLQVLEQEAEALETTASAVALAWTASQRVALVLLGARSRTQLEENLVAAELTLPGSTVQKLQEVSQALDALIPGSEDNPFFHRW